MARLRRIAKDKQTPPAAKVDAELGCWSVARDLVAALQSLGDLPTAQQQLALTHRVEEAPSYADLQTELERVQGIVGGGSAGGGGDSEMVTRLTRIKDTVARLSLSEELRALAPKGQEPGHE